MTASTLLPVADRFVLTLGLLCRAVAARIAGRGMEAAVIVLVWQRVRRVERQILGLLARFRAGRLAVRREVRAGGGIRRGRVGSARLPRGFGWLLPMVPGEAAAFAGQLRGILAEPEMVALLAAAPQARRVLAPVCRMLAIEAGVLEVVRSEGSVPAGAGTGVWPEGRLGPRCGETVGVVPGGVWDG